MKIKNKIIIILLCLGVIMFSFVQFIIVPKQKAEEKKYLSEQLEATTQDINYILPYRSKYIGDVSKLWGLFRSLPLSTNEMTFENFADNTTQVNFKETIFNVGERSIIEESSINPSSQDELNTIYKSLIYNSTAAFALIDNLQGITYHFSDVEYKVKRKDIENLYSNFDKISEEERWKEGVQEPLNDETYITKTFDSIFTK